jgi:hypothetical protein
MDPANQIWNRAALEDGGAKPRLGDRALSALLSAHDMVCNGGVVHCIEVLSKAEVVEACNGFRFFGMDVVAELLMEAAGAVTREDARTGSYDEEVEFDLDRRYGELIPDDGVIETRFLERYQSNPEDFAPV